MLKNNPEIIPKTIISFDKEKFFKFHNKIIQIIYAKFKGKSTG